MKISPAVCFDMVIDAGWSPSRRTMLAGRHSFSTNTITTMHVSELMMSVSSGPMKFDTYSCMPANDSPHAMIAGRTSSAFLGPVITTTR